MIRLPRRVVSGLAIVLLSAGAIPAAQARLPQAAPATPSDASKMYQAYVSGDAEKAVEYFARLARNPMVPSGPLDDPSSGIAAGAGPHPGGLDLGRLTSSLLRTEVGMRAGTFGKYAMSAPLQSARGSVGLNGMFEVNSLVAYREMDGLLRTIRGEVPSDAGLFAEPRRDVTPAAREEMVGAVRSWYVVTTSHCLRWHLDCADALLAAAQKSFGPNPEVLLLAGASAESHERPAAAETLLREAIAGDASLVEAHLRLGRLLLAAGRTAEARHELDRALADARSSGNSFVVYFASRSLADLDERAGRTASTKAHSEEAVAAKPFGDPLFVGLQPLAIYRAAEFYEQPRRIAALRALVRR